MEDFTTHTACVKLPDQTKAGTGFVQRIERDLSIYSSAKGLSTRKVLLLVILLITGSVLSFNAQAQTAISLQTGSWGAATTWAKSRTGLITSSLVTNRTIINGTGTQFTTELLVGEVITNNAGTVIGTIASIQSSIKLTLTANAAVAVIAGSYRVKRIPASTDAVTISNGHTVTVDGIYSCASVDISDGNASTTTTLTVSGSNTLTVTGAITLDPPASGTTNSVLDVAAGTVNCASLNSSNSGSNSRDCKVNITTGTLTVSGNIAMDPTTARNDITIGNLGLLKVGGNFVGGTLNAAVGSTVEYYGANQNVAAYSYHHLVTSGTGTKTLQGNVAINGNLTVNTNTTFDFSSTARTVTVAGNVSGEGTIKMAGNGDAHILDLGGASNAIGTLTTTNSSGSTINYNRSGNQEIFESTNYQNLTVSGSGVKTISEDITVNGNLSVSSTIDFGAVEKRLITVNGNLSGGGTIQMTGAALAHVLNLKGVSNAITTLNTSNNSGSTVNYFLTGNQQVFASSNYQNLTISGSGTKTLQGTTVANGDLNVFSGTLELNDDNLTVMGLTSVSGILNDGNNGGTNVFTGKVTVNNGGSTKTSNNSTSLFTFQGGIQNDGTFTLPATSPVTFSGNDQILNGSAGITLSGTINVTGVDVDNQNSALTLGTLNVNPDSKLTHSYSTFPATYSEFTSGNVNNGKFNTLFASNHVNNLVAGTTTMLTMRRGTNAVGSAGYAVRTTDILPAVSAMIVKFDLNVSSVTATGNAAATIMMGSGFTNDASKPSAAASLQVNLTTVAAAYTVTHVGGAGGTSASTTGSRAITWVINASGGTITYTNPSSGTSTVAANKADVWIGTTQFIDEVAVQNAAQAMSEMKIVMDNAVGTITMNNIQITPWVKTAPIACNTISVTPLADAMVNVPFSIGTVFNSGNVFTAELSQSNGNFPGTSIGTLTSTAKSDTIVAIIPKATANGNQYRIRVTSNNPSLSGSDNGTNLIIGQYAVSPYASQSFFTTGTGSQLTASGYNATGYQWGYYRTLGGPITNLTGKTSATYTPYGPDFPGAGTYSLVCKMTVTGGACVAVSNEVLIYVNCPQDATNPNLAINGTFSSGNTGFTSDYTYVTGTNSMYPEGTYSVGNNPYDVHNLFCNMSTAGQRSPVSGGNMLIGNAATSGSKAVWKQTITVTPNTDYVLTFYASSLAGTENSLLFGIYAGCFRTGVDVSVPFLVTNCTWNKYTFQLSSGNVTSVDLSIRNISVAGSGNDIAIDDIQFYACQQVSVPPFPIAAAFTWRGLSNDWNNEDNWGSSCNIPTCNDEVIIPALGTGKVYPVINTNNAYAGTVTIENSATLTVNAGFNLNVCGDFINKGTFTTGVGTKVTFTSTKSPQLISSNVGSTLQFPNVDINKTNASDIVRLSNNVNIGGTLSITKGNLDANAKTLRIGGNFSNASTFTHGNGTVEFNGSANQAFTQTTGTPSFYNLTINTQVPSNTVTFTPSAATVTQVSNQLTLTRGLLVPSGTTEISVTSNQINAVTGHSAVGNSYVFGRLRRAIAGVKPFEFPVGASNKYEFIMINVDAALVGTSYVTAYFNPSNASTQPDVTESNVTYSEACTGGYWTLTPDAEPTTGMYGIEIVPLGFSCSGPSQSLLKRPTPSGGQPNPAWNTGNGAIGPPSRPGGIRRGGLTSFSEIIVASGNQTSLPVQLISFSGQQKNGQVVLTWITASEQNNAYFQIERSEDGATFEPIGLVNGNGTTRTQHTYHFTDVDPLPGVSYYRFRQVDINGQFEYSKTISMKVNGGDKVVMHPNPAFRGQLVHLRVTSREELSYQLSIIDQKGVVRLKQRFDLQIGENDLILPGSDQLESGLYIISTYSDEDPSLEPFQGKLIVR